MTKTMGFHILNPFRSERGKVYRLRIPDFDIDQDNHRKQRMTPLIPLPTFKIESPASGRREFTGKNTSISSHRSCAPMGSGNRVLCRRDDDLDAYGAISGLKGRKHPEAGRWPGCSKRTPRPLREIGERRREEPLGRAPRIHLSFPFLRGC